MGNDNQKFKMIIAKLGTTAAIFTIGIAGNFLSSTIAFGADDSEICIAQKVKEKSFFTTLNYQVNCDHETFSTAKIKTALVIPIPYRWNRVARNRLTELMYSKEYESSGEIREVSDEQQEVSNNQSNEISLEKVSLAFHDSILVFIKSNKNQSAPVLKNYCGVVQTPLREEGLAEVKKVSDFVVSCTKNSKSKHLKGVTFDEFNQYMATTFEAKLTFTTEYRGKGAQGSLHIYQ